MRRWRIICIMLLVLITIGGCSRESAVDWEKEGDPFEKIKVEIKGQKETDEGILYDLVIHNGTDHEILQMKVAMSYRIITENGSMGNNHRIQADRVLDVVKANSYGEVRIMISPAYGYGRKLDTENPEIHMDGYFETLSDVNRFGMSGVMEAYLID